MPKGAETLFYVTDFDEVFGDLYGVESRALADLVAGEPQCEAVVVGDVLANTTYKHVVLAGCFERHWVNEVCGIVNESAARSGGDCLLRLLYGDGLFGLNPYRLGVAAQ